LQPFHHRLAKHLKKLHIPVSPYERLPSYEYDTLQKGVLCHHCRSVMDCKYRELSCTNCPSTELIDSGILRTIIEFQVLFPDKKIKTGIIREWCGNVVSMRTVSRILSAYLKRVEKGRESHYIFTEI